MPCSGGLCPWRPGPGEERDHVRPETGHGLASGPPLQGSQGSEESKSGLQPQLCCVG